MGAGLQGVDRELGAHKRTRSHTDTSVSRPSHAPQSRYADLFGDHVRL